MLTTVNKGNLVFMLTLLSRRWWLGIFSHLLCFTEGSAMVFSRKQTDSLTIWLRAQDTYIF